MGKRERWGDGVGALFAAAGIPLKQKLNVIHGLFNKNATGVGIHPGQTGNILSGAALQKGAELRGAISVDQAMANALGQEDIVPSLIYWLRATDHRLSRDQFFHGV